MTKKCIHIIVVLLPFCTASSQDFGKVLFYTGAGFNMAYGEIGSRDFNKPSGLAKPGYKFDVILVEYQFENGFGVGLKSSISVHPVDDERIEKYLIVSGANEAHVDVESWMFEELSLQGFRTLFQTHYQLLVLTIGIGQAVVNKPQEFYSITYPEASEQTFRNYNSQLKNTIVANTGLSYWIKIGRHFCLVSTIDYTHIPVRASFKTMSENARNILNKNSSTYTQASSQPTNRSFTIYGISAGLKFGFSF